MFGVGGGYLQEIRVAKLNVPIFIGSIIFPFIILFTIGTIKNTPIKDNALSSGPLVELKRKGDFSPGSSFAPKNFNFAVITRDARGRLVREEYYSLFGDSRQLHYINGEFTSGGGGAMSSNLILILVPLFGMSIIIFSGIRILRTRPNPGEENNELLEYQTAIKWHGLGWTLFLSLFVSYPIKFILFRLG